MGRNYAAAKDAEVGIIRFRIADCGLKKKQHRQPTQLPEID
jgi:hypothetical protein